MERVDFGGHPKYYANSKLSLGSINGQGSKKQSSLFDLNPHKGSLGLNLRVGVSVLLLCC